MIKFCALNSNDTSSPQDDDDSPVVTREAQEEEAFGLYRKALGQLQQDKYDEALSSFRELLALPFISRCSAPPQDENDGRSSGGAALPPALMLKYVALKNLGAIHVRRGDARDAVAAYLDAVEIDCTDVTLWYKIGRLALGLYLYPLARIAFEEGLRCSAQHWPCLSNLMTVLYVLNDHLGCLQCAARALRLDSGYVKALVFKEAVFRENPDLKSCQGNVFKGCDPSVFSRTVSKEDEEAVLAEARELREKRRALYTPKKLPKLSLRKKLCEMTWVALGQAMLELYEFIASAAHDSDVSLACKVDLLRSESDDKPVVEAEDAKKESPADSLQQASGNSSGDLVICINPPSDTTSQAELCEGQPQTESGEPQSVQQPTDLGSLAEQLTVVTQELAMPDENNGAPKMTFSGGRRGGKRKRLSLEHLDPSLKRRSARVRNTLRKTQENVNYQELLTQFLPSSLAYEGKDDREDSIPNFSDLNSDHTYGMTPSSSLQEDVDKVVCNTESIEKTESESVQKFINEHRDKHNLMDLMEDYLWELSSREDLLWPARLCDIFVELYKSLRSHIERPSIFAGAEEAENILRHAMSTLLYCEFMMDKIVVAKAQAQPSASVSPRSPGNQLGPEFPSAQFGCDLEFLAQMSVRQGIFKEKWISFVLRAFWAEARFLMLSGEMETAVQVLENVLCRIDYENPTDGQVLKVLITNCKMNGVISREIVQDQLESLQRCQSLEEVHRLFELGRYKVVADLLIQTFKKPGSRGRKLHAKANIPERHAQLILLQESLWNLKDYSGCLIWGEASLNEALNQYLAVTTETLKCDWSNTIVIVLSDIHRCIKQDIGLLGCLENPKLTRMAHNIIKLINVQMDVSESSNEMAVPTVLSWNILYYILKHEEDKIQLLAARSENQSSAVGFAKSSGNASMNGAMPSSLMLFFTAHEHLGRRSWCTTSDGILLFLFVDVVTQELAKRSAIANTFHEDLNNGIEQCFYCLYGHPNRRGKVKHLQEHNAKQVSLTWDSCKQVFDFFKPQHLPGFDSYKTSTVSSELEVLLKRIAALVPSEEDPSNMESSISAYIEGSVDTFPALPDTSSFSPVVLQLYYLLGDYYFKNKEFAKAIRYYTCDTCLNPDRLDSWAGLALSRSAQLEQRINSCEPKSESTIQKRAVSSLRCFKRALQIDATNSALWIEYGSCVYMLQSNASRQLKQSKQFGLSDEAGEALAKRKKELLETAKSCYESANRCEDGVGTDEMWLNHYLLGKITHKMGCPPGVYLEHLYQSLQHLYEMNAKYPRKILYHSPPPLSIESLELYYKIHALSMKYLLKYEETSAPKEELRAIWKFIQKAGNSPFARFLEKADAMEYGSSSEEDDGEESEESVEEEKKEGKPSMTERQAKKRSLESDHDYFHAKKPHIENPEEAKPAADSPSPADSQEVSVVRDILNCLLTVVSEKLASEERRGLSHRAPESTASAPQPTMPKGRDDQCTVRPCVLSEGSGSKAPVVPDEGKSSGRKKSTDSGEKKSTGQSSFDAPAPSKPSKQENSAQSDPFLRLDEAEMKQVLLKTCVHAMKECVSRFPQHFKSVYYLARFYCHSKRSCNLQLARDYLLESGQNRPAASTADATPAAPGLFAERKATNFFTGIWHTPGDEIDRAGSFATHMYRSVMLLIEVLERCGDVDMLAYVAVQLHREPETEKKYLRDVDRTYLARKAFETAMILASRRLDVLMNEEPPPEDDVLVSALLDVYRVSQVFQKAGVFVDEAGAALAESYRLYKLGEVDSSPPIAEQAVMFCARRQHRQSLRALEAAAHGYEQPPIYDADGTAASFSNSL
ncbi:calcineurin-binding protein cabin-1-like [Amblyomma americanum]